MRQNGQSICRTIVSGMYGPATLADISLRIRFTCLRERRRTHHKAQRLGSVRVSGHRHPASSSDCGSVLFCSATLVWLPVGNAQTFIPGISYNPYRNPSASGFLLRIVVLRRCFYFGSATPEVRCSTGAPASPGKMGMPGCLDQNTCLPCI